MPLPVSRKIAKREPYRVKKTASFGKSLVLNGWTKFISRIWWSLLHETDDGEVMKMQAHYTDPLKPARPPLSTTPYPLILRLAVPRFSPPRCGPVACARARYGFTSTHVHVHVHMTHAECVYNIKLKSVYTFVHIFIYVRLCRVVCARRRDGAAIFQFKTSTLKVSFAHTPTDHGLSTRAHGKVRHSNPQRCPQAAHIPPLVPPACSPASSSSTCHPPQMHSLRAHYRVQVRTVVFSGAQH